ncbi:MAG: dihydropteroate synthase [Myxococcota bacterium]
MADVRVQIMGILNRTPDSFFDGGRYEGRDEGHRRVDALVAEGADIIDIGAESSRPGSTPVSVAEQIDRLGDIVAYAASSGTTVSIDTLEPDVAAFALTEGAAIVNSVSLEPAAALGAVAQAHGAELVLTHCRGAMSAMKGFSDYAEQAYDGVIEEVGYEWNRGAEAARQAGLDDERIIFDPGFGFAKNAEQSLTLANNLEALRQRTGPGRRILAGVGRKSYLAKVAARQLGEEVIAVEERLALTIAGCIHAVLAGADILRVHDVAPVRQALAYWRAAAPGEVPRC